MTRPLTAGMAAAVAAESGQILHFIELQFEEGTARFTTAPHDVPWNGVTWSGIGGVLTFGGVPESSDLSAAGVELTLAGVDPSVTALVLTQHYLGRTVRVWLGHLDPVKQTVIADPVQLFQGYMNGGWTVKESHDPSSGAGTVEITTRCQDRLGDLELRRGIQTNPESLGRFFPGDRFFNQVAALMVKKLPWGQPQ